MKAITAWTGKFKANGMQTETKCAVEMRPWESTSLWSLEITNQIIECSVCGNPQLQPHTWQMKVEQFPT